MISLCKKTFNCGMLVKLPTAVIFLTDGYAVYPPEEMALHVPVLWIITDNAKDTPWGITVHVTKDVIG